MLINRQERAGTTVVESAFVYPILILLLFGLIVLSLAVFRYQQVAHIARESSRWASVHGAGYASHAGVPPTTPEDVYQNAILPQATSMRPDQIEYSVVWSNNGDQRPSRAENINDQIVSVANTVSVTVIYHWVDAPLFGPIRVSSTSVTTMSY